MANPEDDFGPPESPELFSLGIIGGGMTPHNQLIAEALMALMRAVRDRRQGYPNEGLCVNLVFHTPGPISKPDFEGVHAARFARKTNHLLVNAAVPESLQLDEVRDYFVQVLRETKAVTLAYLRKRKISVDTTNVMSLIDDVASERAAS